MPPDYVKHYLENAQICKEHNIELVCKLLSEDDAFYKAVINYSRSARRDANWQ